MRARGWWQAAVLLLVLAACGGEAKAPAATAPEPATPEPVMREHGAKPEGKAAAAAPADDPSRPVSERIRGRWRMNVAGVPDTALTEDFRKAKQQGRADQMRIEYTITESEFVLDTWGPAGRQHKKFHYEILKEIDNSLMLKRIGEDGKEQEIPAVLKDGKLIIGTGNGEVPLERIE